MSDFLYAVIFFLPAGIANMTPVLANKIPVFNRWRAPMDFGRSFRGQRVFGANKTWRGLVYGAVLGGLVGAVVFQVWPSVFETFKISANPFLVGALLGAGALVGDAVESFFKRQNGVKPGESWFPFDQTDYIIGGLLFVWPLASLTLQTAGIIFISYFGLHVIVSYIGYLLKFKDKPI